MFHAVVADGHSMLLMCLHCSSDGVLTGGVLAHMMTHGQHPPVVPLGCSAVTTTMTLLTIVHRLFPKEEPSVPRLEYRLVQQHTWPVTGHLMYSCAYGAALLGMLPGTQYMVLSCADCLMARPTLVPVYSVCMYQH